jgi:hypothetical protein
MNQQPVRTFLVALGHFSLGFLDHALDFLLQMLFSVVIKRVKTCCRRDCEYLFKEEQWHETSLVVVALLNFNGHGVGHRIRKLPPIQYTKFHHQITNRSHWRRSPLFLIGNILTQFDYSQLRIWRLRRRSRRHCGCCGLFLSEPVHLVITMIIATSRSFAAVMKK